MRPQKFYLKATAKHELYDNFKILFKKQININITFNVSTQISTANEETIYIIQRKNKVKSKRKNTQNKS